MTVIYRIQQITGQWTLATPKIIRIILKERNGFHQNCSKPGREGTQGADNPSVREQVVLSIVQAWPGLAVGCSYLVRYY